MAPNVGARCAALSPASFFHAHLWGAAAACERRVSLVMPRRGTAAVAAGRVAALAVRMRLAAALPLLLALRPEAAVPARTLRSPTRPAHSPLLEADVAAAPLILGNLSTLLGTRARIAAGDSALANAQQLRADAEAAMGAEFWTEGSGPWSVMNKSLAGPSGDKHDYFSVAKYCWPVRPFRVSACAARTLNPTGQSRVTLSLR